MALDAWTPPDPFAETPDAGSLWDMVSRLVVSPQAAPGGQPSPPASGAPTPAAPGESLIEKLTTPRQAPWAEALRTFLLNMPFGVAIGTEAVKRGVPTTTAGQILKPMIERGENQRLWGAFQESGFVPKGANMEALQRAGVDPKTGIMMMRLMGKETAGVPISQIPGYRDQFPDMTDAEWTTFAAQHRVTPNQAADAALEIATSKANAGALRREAARLGVPEEEIASIPPMVNAQGATMYRQRFGELRKGAKEGETRARLAQQYQAITGRPAPMDMDPSVMGQMISNYYSEQASGRREAAADARHQQSQGLWMQHQTVLEKMRIEGEDRAKIRSYEMELLKNTESELKDTKKEISTLKFNADPMGEGKIPPEVQTKVDELELQTMELDARKKKLQQHGLSGGAKAATPKEGAPAVPSGAKPNIRDRYK